MKAVLDTNVLVSGTFWTGKSFEIIKLLELKGLGLILSKELIDEYNETINSEEIIDKIENKNLIVNEIIKKIISEAEIVEPSQKFEVVKGDPDDNKILECAVEGKADFIVSQDSHLLKLREFHGIRIMSPEEFLEMLP